MNLSGTGCRSTRKMAAQSESQGINQQKCVEFGVSPAVVATAEVTIWPLAGPAPSWL